MKRLCAILALSLLPAALPAQASSVTPDFIGLMKSTDDAIVEATVVSARLHTWRDAKGDRICGRSYEVVVNEVLWGKAAPRETLAQSLWWPRETHLRDLIDDPMFAVGGTYVIGIMHDAARDHGFAGADSLAREGGLDATDAKAMDCLRSLPQDFLGGGTRVLKEPAQAGESYSGMPGAGREYVRIPSTRAIEDTVVFGAFYERFYAKTDKLDPKARGYLSRDGIYQAPAAKPEIDRQYLMDTGRNGSEWIFYDAVVPYDDFKRLIRDPNRQPIIRF